MGGRVGLLLRRDTQCVLLTPGLAKRSLRNGTARVARTSQLLRGVPHTPNLASAHAPVRTHVSREPTVVFVVRNTRMRMHAPPPAWSHYMCYDTPLSTTTPRDTHSPAHPHSTNRAAAFRLHGVVPGMHEYVPVTFDDKHFCIAELCVHSVLSGVTYRSWATPTADADSGVNGKKGGADANGERCEEPPPTFAEFLFPRLRRVFGAAGARVMCKHEDASLWDRADELYARFIPPLVAAFDSAAQMLRASLQRAFALTAPLDPPLDPQSASTHPVGATRPHRRSTWQPP